MFRTILMFSFFLLISCGESPLLNHKLEGKDFLTDTFRSESDVLRFAKSGYSFVISWQEGPQLGTSKFLIHSWKDTEGTLNGPFQDLPATLHVFLWMPSMGHGSAPVKLTRRASGEYEVSDVQFIMGGKWEIKFQLKNGNLVTDETIVPVSL